MFNRKDALELLAATFPEKDITSKDYINGGEKTVRWDANARIKQTIDLFEPRFDALKSDEGSLSEEDEEAFRSSVDHDYKNENGLWP